MEKYSCLICNREMISYSHESGADYHCKNFRDEHHFGMRIVGTNMITLRVRFSENDERLCLKVHYDRGYSEVWNELSMSPRIKINQIIVPDFMDIEGLKNKIKTILVFG